ncbi:23S rRNA (adenine(1618)-N(6))-methyltransferase RlmF [Thaumasiovibrio sp. DFM-14]|uniref:23S rRNA (adenine(1618)-N(6))-methyltransferase RlmF n=1 Tax=Thaumasiovibrio sp. DFM-14 TaxID=3384792 RepID=UPI0039A28A20
MNVSKQKSNLHKRSKHQNGYNFDALVKVNPELKRWVTKSPTGRSTIPFAEPKAVLALNSALLAYHYNIKFWAIPDGNLCPPIPGRAEYIHYLADLLAKSNKGVIPQGESVVGLDIGTGANCIYPLLGNKEYGWQFIASDIQAVSISAANNIIVNNGLQHAIRLIEQSNANHFFSGVINKKQRILFTMCNPPFHRSAKEAQQGTQRKRNNLNSNQAKRGQSGQAKHGLNFGGNANELWCQGGEQRFVSDMIKESKEFKENVLWFTSLISKSDNLRPLKKQINAMGATQYRICEMQQGNKISRFIAWTFIPTDKHCAWISDL